MEHAELLGTRVSTPSSHPTSSAFTMTKPRVSVRADVARAVWAVSHFVETTCDNGSAMGRMAIDPTRVGKDESEIDLETASAVQILEAICLAELRRKIWTKPEKPVVMPTPRTTSEPEGKKPLRCVAPTSLVTHVVKVKRARTYPTAIGGTRDWRTDFGFAWRVLGRDERSKLTEAAEAARDLVHYTNRHACETSILQRMGRRDPLRKEQASKVRFLGDKMRESRVTLEAAVRSDAYRVGILRLAKTIESKSDLERSIYGGMKAL